MPDTNEERLLTDLLRDIANADSGLAGSAELERRVIAAWDTRDTHPSGSGPWTVDAGRWTIANHPWAASLGAVALGAAALGAAALVLAVTVVMQLGVTTNTRRIDPVERRPEIVAPIPQPTDASDEAAAVPKTMSASVARPRRRAGPQNEIVSFVPLVPMTADELSGSFSIARVQIGRTEADVLLGEDGMARAIRVATNGSAPGRLR
jgi:hypothetical protein